MYGREGGEPIDRQAVAALVMPGQLAIASFDGRAAGLKQIRTLGRRLLQCRRCVSSRAWTAESGQRKGSMSWALKARGARADSASERRAATRSR
jgi:hypothetical protein